MTMTDSQPAVTTQESPSGDANANAYASHQSRAGKRGGASRSWLKRRAAQANLKKARAKRYPAHALMQTTPETSARPQEPKA